MHKIIYDEMKDIFELNSSSPSYLSWKRSGKHCLSQKTDGYYVVNLHNKQHFSHRIVYCLYHRVDLIGGMIDHINRNKQDNYPENLRIANYAINNLNRTPSKNTNSGIVGVKYLVTDYGEYWIARWSENKKLKEKVFNVKDYGYETAKRLAIEFRQVKYSEQVEVSLLSLEQKGN